MFESSDSEPRSRSRSSQNMIKSSPGPYQTTDPYLYQTQNQAKMSTAQGPENGPISCFPQHITVIPCLRILDM